MRGVQRRLSSGPLRVQGWGQPHAVASSLPLGEPFSVPCLAIMRPNGASACLCGNGCSALGCRKHS
ncbi:hypothetical protein BS50DRAFT_201143 [Corynespora cassiicola Philippines]|uniref:Uncharacterized protein n=1 Tax=Corynespora cassiicola Philippines TaxID=1448308 RepID=A0A2T2N545_CORCC|nr:hypothetical protein BS50DRAFT_201143 [Corynespora cassiicola Philippines]